MNRQCALSSCVDTRIHQVSTVAFNRFGLIGTPSNIIGSWDGVGTYGCHSDIGLSKNTIHQEFGIVSFIGDPKNIKRVSKNKSLGYIG